jgi:hypothetical protein
MKKVVIHKNKGKDKKLCLPTPLKHVGGAEV